MQGKTRQDETPLDRTRNYSSRTQSEKSTRDKARIAQELHTRIAHKNCTQEFHKDSTRTRTGSKDDTQDLNMKKTREAHKTDQP